MLTIIDEVPSLSNEIPETGWLYKENNGGF